MSKNLPVAPILGTSAVKHQDAFLDENSPEKIDLGPIEIDAMSLTELAHTLVGHAFARDETNHVVTANAQFYVLAEKNEEFRACVRDAEYVCADGVSLLIASKWLAGVSLDRVPGVELVASICEEAARFGLSIYFLGGKPGSAARSASILMHRFPGFRLAGVSCPPLGFLKRPEILRQVLDGVKAAKPSIIFVALGAPRQEFFIRDYIRDIGVPVAIGVGGSMEIICGAAPRAPMWMRGAGLEWLFRWYKEPLRLTNRYLIGNVIFFFYLARNLMKRKRNS
jgi:N-acetylglucosaminyldiphosphoundecaprenol N-acetyl-beta-D-mannosaminyltransferase